MEMYYSTDYEDNSESFAKNQSQGSFLPNVESDKEQSVPPSDQSEDIKLNVPAPESINGDRRHGSNHDEEETVRQFCDEKEKNSVQLYFHDGERKIDYVLAYTSNSSSEKEKDRSFIRSKFEESLEENGLELEIEPKENSPNMDTVFVKLHLPWEICVLYAEKMKLKMPLKSEYNDKAKQMIKEETQPADCGCDCDWSFAWLQKLWVSTSLTSNEMYSKVGTDNRYTAEFVKEKIEFFDIRDQTTFFSDAERSRITHRILSESSFGTKPKNIGIDRLLLNGVYDAAFPLHSGNYRRNYSKMPKDENDRRLLFWQWARWGRWYKQQPLDLIKHYFGDKIAIYFAWLGFYTAALAIPSIVGFLCFLYSIAAVWSYPPTQEICDETYSTYIGNLVMCPLCDRECTYWKLNNACLSSRVTAIFDNESTIFFAIFMSLWATMFLEFWKRYQFSLSYQWDLIDYDQKRDLIRPEFEAAQAQKQNRRALGNPARLCLEPFGQYSRLFFSFITVLFWIAVVCAAVFSIIVFRLAINATFAATVNLTTLGTLGNLASPSVLTTITASLLSVLVILVLNKIYEKVSLYLTYLELPKTQKDFEDSFSFKMFCFNFVNYYSYPFYIAFFKNSFAGYPGNYNYLFGIWRWEQCDIGGCMYELTLQLFVIMFAKQMWNNIVEILYPWVFNKYRQCKSRMAEGKKEENDYTRWEKDFDLYPLEQLDLFYEYLEIVIQYGFVTLFVVAFPLAPLLALFNNIIEIRLDANKFLCQYRRPVAQKTSAIGVWYHLLDIMGTMAVITNAFTIAVTSEAIPKLVYYYAQSPEIYGTQTLVGYTNDSLSIFNVSDFQPQSIPENTNPFIGENVTQCRYHDYRNPPSDPNRYQLTEQYWHTVAARLAFVITMEHVVFFLKYFLDILIPDRSNDLQEKIKEEHFIVQNMLLKAEKEKFKKELQATVNFRRISRASMPSKSKLSSIVRLKTKKKDLDAILET